MSKVWFVTGCSRGLGREIARAVLAAGDRLVATARDRRDLDFLVSADRLLTVALDVRDGLAARAAVAEAVSAFGRLDVVVNNAGYIKASSIEDLPEEEFRRQIDVNFFGVYNVTRAVLPVMRAQRDGHGHTSRGRRCALARVQPLHRLRHLRPGRPAFTSTPHAGAAVEKDVRWRRDGKNLAIQRRVELRDRSRRRRPRTGDRRLRSGAETLTPCRATALK